MTNNYTSNQSEQFKDKTITLKNLMAKKGEDNQNTIPKEKLVNEVKKFL